MPRDLQEELLNIDLSRLQRQALERAARWQVSLILAGINADEASRIVDEAEADRAAEEFRHAA